MREEGGGWITLGYYSYSYTMQGRREERKEGNEGRKERGKEKSEGLGMKGDNG